jgi:hypothetical protein
MRGASSNKSGLFFITHAKKTLEAALTTFWKPNGMKPLGCV